MRWTLGSLLAALRTDTVPATAGLMKSSGFSTFQWKGEAVWTMALRTNQQPTDSRAQEAHSLDPNHSLSEGIVLEPTSAKGRESSSTAHILEIGDHRVVELIIPPVLVHLFHPLSLLLISGGTADGIPLLKQIQAYPTGNVAAGAGNQH